MALPVHVLWYGYDKNGRIRFFELEHPHGVHNCFQQYLGAALHGMERCEQANPYDYHFGDTGAHWIDIRDRTGELFGLARNVKNVGLNWIII